MAKQNYVWNWEGGGYNSCAAESLEEATRIAIAMGQPRVYPEYTTVLLVPVNVRLDADYSQTWRLDESYRGMFD